ncbi:MAG: hypothetical protein AB1411_12375 [Nitrospirota bacterium]
MTHRMTVVFMLGLVGTLGVAVAPSWAQNLPAPSSPQSQLAQSPAEGSQLPALPGTTTVPTTQPSTAPGLNQTPSSGRPAPSAGRGLPGMPGGSSLNAPMGAGDPAARFSRPPVIGPVTCDLVLDPACL